MSKFLLLSDAAARVTAAGIPISERGVRGWAERHPAISVRIGARRAIHIDALEMILDGVPLREVATRMLNTRGSGTGQRDAALMPRGQKHEREAARAKQRDLKQERREQRRQECSAPRDTDPRDRAAARGRSTA